VLVVTINVVHSRNLVVGFCVYSNRIYFVVDVVQKFDILKVEALLISPEPHVNVVFQSRREYGIGLFFTVFQEIVCLRFDIVGKKTMMFNFANTSSRCLA